MELYHKTAFGISKIITSNYSTSFSLGIKAFAPEYRDAIYAVYGYVRLADEIVDSFHGYDKKKLLNDFRRDTFNAIEYGISANPVIHSFQLTVNEYGIDKKYVDDFLTSMEMDLYNNYYEADHYNEYIYGSAEVVGLMCLKVFCKGDNDLFKKLIGPAKSLGSAFQKINFLRDIKSDIDERGRIYLPGVDNSSGINNYHKKQLEKDVELEFNDALRGIKMLPAGVRLGVYSAYLYYWVLFKKIKRMNASDLLNRRIRISNFTKILLLIKSLLEVKVLKTC